MPLIKIFICQDCLDGIGEECHTPECALCWHKVDIPFNPDLYEVIGKDWLNSDELTESYKGEK